MNLNKLYDIAESENIKIYNWHFEDINGIYLNYDKINAIALNYDTFGTYIDEKCTLAEELGHYYMNATYSLSSDSNFINKQEYKAKKWQIKTLIPVNELSNLLKQGYHTLSDIAEKLEVTEDLVKNAFIYYTNNNIIKSY